MKKITLKEIALARSGDKGSNANIGVIALDEKGYNLIDRYLTEQIVQEYFKTLGVAKVTRYSLPNLQAFNFVLDKALAEGGSRSLRIDAQGKALGQALLQLQLSIED